MRTQKMVEARIKYAAKELAAAQKCFDKYDNHEDKELVELYKEELITLEWVLGAER